MAVIPNAWALWNVVHVAVRPLARLSIGGRSSEAFTLQTLPPCEDADAARAAETVAASARRFARPVTDIDRELEAAIGSLPEDPGSEDSRRRKG